MTTLSGRLLLWGPRILGVLVSMFVGLFALDAFNQGTPFLQALPGFFIHMLPAFILLALVSASWRREWIGGVGFIALAVAYSMMARGHVDWMLAISGPLLVVGTLFLWSWRHHGELHVSA